MTDGLGTDGIGTDGLGTDGRGADGLGTDSGSGAGTAADNVQSSVHRAGPLFWVSALAGWVLIGVGLWGIFSNRLDTRPANLAKFVFGGALLHDLLFAPLVLLAAVGLARVVPRRARSTVLGALFVTGALALFAYPLVRAYGLAANNPTSLPYNYGLNLAILVGVVWAVAAVVLVVRLRPRRGG